MSGPIIGPDITRLKSWFHQVKKESSCDIVGKLTPSVSTFPSFSPKKSITMG